MSEPSSNHGSVCTLFQVEQQHSGLTELSGHADPSTGGHVSYLHASVLHKLELKLSALPCAHDLCCESAGSKGSTCENMSEVVEAGKYMQHFASQNIQL